MESSPFLIQRDASGDGLEPVGRQEGLYDEAWLQELLRRHPRVLPVGEIEPVFVPLVPVGVEVATERGAIDNLFISHRGYLVLVETKLWRNPEARREVVAQAIDYASCLSKWDYRMLDSIVRKYTSEYEETEANLVEWVEREFGPVDGGRAYFEETVEKNLRLGRFLTLIVGDRIRRSLADMLEYANRYPHLATNVVLAELRCYHLTSEDEWPLLVVPRVVARTEIVERSIVQVTVGPIDDYEIEVRQERAEKEDKGRRGVTLTEEAFWEILKEQAPGEHAVARRLVNEYRDRAGIIIDPGEGSVIVRLSIQDTGQRVSLFFVGTHGRVLVWPPTIKRQVEEAGVPVRFARQYEARVREVMDMGPDRVEFNREVSQIDLDQFTDAVDRFIEQIQSAELVDE